MRIRNIFLIISVFTLISCGSGGSNEQTNIIDFNNNEKQFLENLFKTKYLYKDKISTKISTLNYNNYDNAQDMIDAYKYDTLDRWSYSETFKHYEQRSTQTTSGFGCYFKGKQVKQIKIDSPCYTSGIKRGDILYEINDKNITSKSYKQYSNNLNEQVIFNIKRYNYQKSKWDYLKIQITPKKYTYKVSKYKIFTRNSDGYKIAYFLYDSFSSRSVEEIDDAFNFLKNENVEDIIIDLRYNSGGAINTVAYFLDKLVKNQDNNLQFSMKFNNQYSHYNKDYYFETQSNSIDFKNIIFLTTNTTASASELLINSLKPYTNVSLIGSKTRGKPVGMRMENLGNKLIYWLINFSNYNSNNIGDYYNGLDVNCEVDDEIFHSRDDKNDKLLANALYYFDNNRCQ